MNIDNSAVVTDFGNFYIDAGQSLKDIRQMMYKTRSFGEEFTYIPTKDTVLRGINLEGSYHAQAYQEAFTPSGSTVTLPTEIPLFRQKIDETIIPERFGESYAGFLEAEELRPVDYPFTKYWLMQVVLPKVLENHEMHECYKGVYVAPTVGVPSAVGTNMNGIRKTINDSADKVVIPTGAWPTVPEDFVTAIEDWQAEIPDPYNKAGLTINMSNELELRYIKGMRVKYNMQYAQTSDLKGVMDTNFKVKGHNAMSGSAKIWASPKANCVRTVKRAALKTMFNYTLAHRGVDVDTFWYEGYGFWNHKELFTNDLDLV